MQLADALVVFTIILNNIDSAAFCFNIYALWKLNPNVNCPLILVLVGNIFSISVFS